MKHKLAPLLSIVLLAASCSVKTNTSSNSDSVTVAEGLSVSMQMKDTIKAGEPLQLQFTVNNPSNTVQRFLKWHTPFEPLISKYLDIRDENGNEVSYRGAMARRMMPPPASDTLSVGPKQSLSETVDLLQGYAIEKPSRYTIIYSGGNISSLQVKDSVSFVYVR